MAWHVSDVASRHLSNVTGFVTALETTLAIHDDHP